MKELIVAALPDGSDCEGALYPDGAHITDIKEVRGLLYQMQRPGIAPKASCPTILEGYVQLTVDIRIAHLST